MRDTDHVNQDIKMERDYEKGEQKEDLPGKSVDNTTRVGREHAMEMVEWAKRSESSVDYLIPGPPIPAEGINPHGVIYPYDIEKEVERKNLERRYSTAA